MAGVPPHLSTLADLKVNEPLAPYTYAKVGGPADYLLIITSTDSMIAAITAAAADSIPVTVLGAGSNVLVADNGLDGLILINRAQSITTKEAADHTLVTAESGVVINQLVNITVQQGLAGLEEFLGLPGTVGGAVYNNSHHLKHLIGDTIKEVAVVNRQGHPKILSHDQMEFAYDSSVLQTTHDIVLSATFALTKGDPTDLQKKALAALKRRRDSQPLEFPSCGCVFKNPEGTSAGLLIDQAGLKGTRVGDVEISHKHASFMINHGHATAEDYKKLSDLVVAKVKAKTGITLEREVFFIGRH